jgi:DNA helicase-2/ATP-dependent DNA helicase PcrA
VAVSQVHGRDRTGVTDGSYPDGVTALLDGLNPEQRAAAEAVRGPVCIVAGAGTGKTRTITHRIAHQVAIGAARPEEILAVTFTDRAANELRARLAALGTPRGVQALTFHAAALRQLRYFAYRNGPMPEILESKLRLLVPAAKARGVQAADLATEIEWAKARRLTAEAYADEGGSTNAPLPPDLMAGVYRRYEADKTERNLLDFEDLLLRAADLFTGDAEAAAAFRGRYRCFTVDEFQDVNLAQWTLLRAWLGDSRELCVVGDDDQTIYSFTGATADYLTGFPEHFPDATRITLTRNYRSTPQILALANRVLSSKTLVATEPDGAPPAVRPLRDGDGEVAAVVARIRALLAEGVPAGEIAVCYRINSQSEPFETALRAAGVPFVVRGDRGFFQRPEIRQALGLLAAAGDGPADRDPPRPARQVEQVLREGLSWHPRRPPDGERARERWQNLSALHEAAVRYLDDHADAGFREVVDELRRRAAAGADAPDERGAVTLLTLHRAKGLEFDAVFLVALEEGLLPFYRAETPAELAEERRLFYVGVTRARRHLWLSHARRRQNPWGRWEDRRASRFLAPPRADTPRANTARADAERPPAPGGLAEQLRAWRSDRARRDGVPAYVVFPDRTLAALADQRPRTRDELRAVPGFGAKRVATYGEEVLAVLADPSSLPSR